MGGELTSQMEEPRMTLRNGKRVGESYRSNEHINVDIDEPATLCPLVTKATRQTQHEPWSQKEQVNGLQCLKKALLVSSWHWVI